MKSYDIAFYTFMLCLTISFVNTLGMFPTQIVVEDQTARIEEITDIEIGKDISEYQEGYSVPSLALSIGSILMHGLFGAVFVFPVLVRELGMPALLAGLLQAAVTFIYVIGAVQFILNRSIKNFE